MRELIGMTWKELNEKGQTRLVTSKAEVNSFKAYQRIKFNLTFIVLALVFLVSYFSAVAYFEGYVFVADTSWYWRNLINAMFPQF